MIRRTMLVLVCTTVIVALLGVSFAQAEQAYGRQWGRSYNTQDWNRLYHYPYVYYPQNFWGQDYYRSSDDLYYRYPPEMQVPVYNQQWHSEYPQHRKTCPVNQNTVVGEAYRSGVKYHTGHHFNLDVF